MPVTVEGILTGNRSCSCRCGSAFGRRDGSGERYAGGGALRTNGRHPDPTNPERPEGVPGDSTWIKVLDLNKQVEAGSTGVVLATLMIRGDELGTTTLRAVATAMDDDNGTAMDPASAEETLVVTRQVPQLPGGPAPTDPDGDGLYEDVNGNGRMDFNDVVLFFTGMEWIGVQDGSGYFDFNGNGRIDFDDVVRLFWGV